MIIKAYIDFILFIFLLINQLLGIMGRPYSLLSYDDLHFILYEKRFVLCTKYRMNFAKMIKISYRVRVYEFFSVN